MLSFPVRNRSISHIPNIYRRSLSALHTRVHLRPTLTSVAAKKGQQRQTTQSSTLESSDWSIQDVGDQQAWLRKDLHVVLVEAKIPQNVGNIARTCAASRVGLHLVGPLGFEVDDKKIKRAGLDYWGYVAVKVYESWQDFYSMFQGLKEPKRLIGYSKFSTTHYASEGTYRPGDWLLFGAETSGLPQEAHQQIPASGGVIVKIPMEETHVRSLNLATSVGIGLYEAKRQLDGPVF